MAAPKFNRRYNFDKTKHVISESADFSKDPPMAVQGEDTSLEHLLQRHTRGQEVAIFKGIYAMENDDEFDKILPEFDKMDRIERLHFGQKLRHYIKEKRELLGTVGERKLDEQELKDAAEDVKAGKEPTVE